jgi:hypothetical protein
MFYRSMEAPFCQRPAGKTIDEFVNHMNFLHAMGRK